MRFPLPWGHLCKHGNQGSSQTSALSLAGGCAVRRPRPDPLGSVLCVFARDCCQKVFGQFVGHAIVVEPVRVPTPSLSSAPVDVASTAPPSAVRSQASTEDFPTNLPPARHGTAEAPPVNVLAWRAVVIASELQIHPAVAQLRIAELRVAAAKKHYRVAVAQCLALHNLNAEDSEVQPTKMAPLVHPSEG